MKNPQTCLRSAFFVHLRRLIHDISVSIVARSERQMEAADTKLRSNEIDQKQQGSRGAGKKSAIFDCNWV